MSDAISRWEAARRPVMATDVLRLPMWIPPPTPDEQRIAEDERIGGPLLHRCFICGSERMFCGHREPELLGWYRGRG